MKPSFASNIPHGPAFLKKWALPSLFALCASLVSLSAKASVQSRIFAPYIEMGTPNLAQMSQASGIKYFTLAFIIDNGNCQGLWEAGGPVSSDTTVAPIINSLRAAGGDVIISFGGAAGNELADSCTSVANIQAQYQAIINKYNVTALDF
ncbi:MAG TPA: hypothetical protein VNW23_04480, partial [Opitutaceae bacterium]|nr:hypothetical protein [Opitutaceae bacterium]